MILGNRCLLLIRRGLSTSTSNDRGLLRFSRTNNKSYLKVRGPDSPKFLNGLLTSKVIPFFVKKNLTTINPGEEELTNTVFEFDETQTNWGVYNEMSYNGAYISRFGQYAGILNSKGKLITDTILYPTPLSSTDAKVMRYPTYLLEFDASIVDYIQDLFNIHKLTSKVKIKKANDLISWDLSLQLPPEPTNPWVTNLLDPSTTTKTPEDALAFAQEIVSAFFQGSEDQIIALYIERRTDEILEANGEAPQMFRVVTTSDTQDVSKIFNPVGLPYPCSIEKVDQSFFRESRFEAGFVDSTSDFKPESLLPLELNFDYLPNAVSADKGCYMGQELTARTLATGILRKRLVPVTLTNTDALTPSAKYHDIMLDPQLTTTTTTTTSSSSPFGIAPTKPRQRPAGSLIANQGNLGVAILRTEHFKLAFDQPQDKILFHIAGTPVGVIPKKPFWLEEQ